MKLSIKTGDVIKAEHGLDEGGRVQKYIDKAVIDFCEPYVPMKTGKLKESPNSCSEIGSGEVVYGVPYAQKQYYTNKGNGLRGARWFERMKADRLSEIVEGAANAAGGKASK